MNLIYVLLHLGESSGGSWFFNMAFSALGLLFSLFLSVIDWRELKRIGYDAYIRIFSISAVVSLAYLFVSAVKILQNPYQIVAWLQEVFTVNGIIDTSGAS